MLKQISGALQCLIPVAACIFLTILYVASLYVWKSKQKRDHPSTIKKRFFSAFIMMIISPFFMRIFLWDATLTSGDIYQQLGLRSSCLTSAIVYPLILTAILFLGPLTMQMLSGMWSYYLDPQYWCVCWRDLVWLRNHLVAPLSEEWVFRACMIPLLLQCLSPMTAVFCGPILFGIAHFHHMLELMRDGREFKSAFLISSFQFMYTSLFGAYSAFLFTRTGHFAAPLVAHIFCNHMGFPNFSEISQHGAIPQALIITSFLCGFGLWCYLLVPWTNPALYNNKLHWSA